jgi:hypothetical protein
MLSYVPQAKSAGLVKAGRRVVMKAMINVVNIDSIINFICFRTASYAGIPSFTSV